MKAKQYVDMFNDLPDVASLQEAGESMYQKGGPVHGVLAGLSSEVAELARRASDSSLESAAKDAFSKGLVEVNRKFRVVRGMLKAKYGISLFRYNGFLDFLEERMGNSCREMGINLQELLK
jgi:hypothetical protein